MGSSDALGKLALPALPKCQGQDWLSNIERYPYGILANFADGI